MKFLENFNANFDTNFTIAASIFEVDGGMNFHLTFDADITIIFGYLGCTPNITIAALYPKFQALNITITTIIGNIGFNISSILLEIITDSAATIATTYLNQYVASQPMRSIISISDFNIGLDYHFTKAILVKSDHLEVNSAGYFYDAENPSLPIITTPPPLSEIVERKGLIQVIF